MGVPSYILFPGIQGNVRKGEYSGWFEADSIQFGRTQQVGGGNVAGPAVTLTDVHVSLQSGAGAANLFQAWQEGKVFPKVKIVVGGEGREAAVVFEVELTSVLISGFSTSAQSSPRAGATVSLTLVFEHYKQKVAGGPTSAGVSPSKRR